MKYFILQEKKNINIIPFNEEHFNYFNVKLSDQIEINTDILECSSFGLLDPLQKLMGIKFDIWGGEFDFEKYKTNNNLQIEEYKTAPSLSLQTSLHTTHILCKISTDDSENIYIIPTDDEVTKLLSDQIDEDKRFQLCEFSSDDKSINEILRMCRELLQIWQVIVLSGFDCQVWKDYDMPVVFKDNLNNVLLSEFDKPSIQKDEVEEVEEKFSSMSTIDVWKFI
jgi:hypothetical protein